MKLSLLSALLLVSCSAPQPNPKPAPVSSVWYLPPLPEVPDAASTAPRLCAVYGQSCSGAETCCDGLQCAPDPATEDVFYHCVSVYYGPGMTSTGGGDRPR